MRKIIMIALLLLSIYIVCQTIYSAFYFRRASILSKTKFDKSLQLGNKNNPSFKLTVYGDSVGVGVGATSFENTLAGKVAEYLSSDHYLIFKNESFSGAKMKDLADLSEPADK